MLTKQQRFRTKNQLAQLLVYQIMKKGLHFDYLVFDSWYASAENLIFFQKLNIIFVTAIKSNRKLRMPFNPIDNKPKRRCKYLRWYQLTCTELAAQTPYVGDYHYYRNRWTIEVMFRDCKQHLSLGKCQSHKSVAPQLRHTAMVFLALTRLELMKSNGNHDPNVDTTIGDIRRYLQNQQLVYVNGQYHVVDISNSKLNWDQINESTDLIDIKNMTSRKTQLAFNFKF